MSEVTWLIISHITTGHSHWFVFSRICLLFCIVVRCLGQGQGWKVYPSMFPFQVKRRNLSRTFWKYLSSHICYTATTGSCVFLPSRTLSIKMNFCSLCKGKWANNMCAEGFGAVQTPHLLQLVQDTCMPSPAKLCLYANLVPKTTLFISFNFKRLSKQLWQQRPVPGRLVGSVSVGPYEPRL